MTFYWILVCTIWINPKKTGWGYPSNNWVLFFLLWHNTRVSSIRGVNVITFNKYEKFPRIISFCTVDDEFSTYRWYPGNTKLNVEKQLLTEHPMYWNRKYLPAMYRYISLRMSNSHFMANSIIHIRKSRDAK